MVSTRKKLILLIMQILKLEVLSRNLKWTTELTFTLEDCYEKRFKGLFNFLNIFCSSVNRPFLVIKEDPPLYSYKGTVKPITTKVKLHSDSDTHAVINMYLKHYGLTIIKSS